MKRLARFALVAMPLIAARLCAAAACVPEKFQGAYGFELSGSTTISGDIKPVAAIGRIVFDGTGGLSGVSSVSFAGYFLGNPITGTYTLQPDCKLAWSAQDDSGGFQHFSGTMTQDLNSGQFAQTDPGGARIGTLKKVADQCSTAGLKTAYDYTISGRIIPMNPGDKEGRVSASGLLGADEDGNLTVPRPGANSLDAGTAAVDSDCIVQMSLSLPDQNAMQFRGVLVDQGRQILAVETDAGTAVTARLTAH
jgi:hypothetical protein